MGIDRHDIMFYRFYRGVSVAMLACLLTPAAFSFFFLPVPRANFFYPAAVLAAVLIGFGLQSLYARVTGNGSMALKSIYTYEDDYVRFESAHAIVPIAICVVLAVVVSNLTRNYLDYVAMLNPADYYDDESIVPFMVALVTFVCMFLGNVIWFFPPHYLARPRVFFPCLAVMAIQFAASVYGITAPQGVWLICASGFFIGAFILLNQTQILKTFRGSVVSIITPRVRFFNLRLVAVIMVIAIFLYFFLAVVFTGLSIIVKGMFFFILYSTFEETILFGEEQYYESTEQATAFAKAVFGRNYQDATQNQLLFAIFILVIVMGFLLLMLRKKIYFNKIFAKFDAWFANIMAFFSLSYDLNMKVPKRGRFTNYRDEENKLQNAKISEYNKTHPADGYKDFRIQLAKLKTYDEKIGYSYKTLITVYQKTHIKVKNSDTPRQAEVKIKYGAETPEINEITEALEQVKYAGVDISKQDKQKAEEILEKISTIIKRYMY